MMPFVRRAAPVLFGLALACGGDPPPASEAPPVPVRAVEATLSMEGDPIHGSGVVASASEVPLAFRIPGYVAEIVVEEGARVAPGQTLARLRMAEAEAQLRAAEAQAERAARQFGRMERLVADSVVTRAQADEAREAHERAEAGVELARFALDNATIRAPGEGRVLRRLVEEATFVDAGRPVIQFASTSGGWVVRVGLPDRDVTRVALDRPARVRVPALGADRFDGRVTEIADAADPTSGTFSVEVTLDRSPDGPLPAGIRSGLVAEVEIPVPGDTPWVHLPLHAVVDARGGRGAVFVLDGSRALRREVRIVRVGDGTVALDAPDLVGRRVITDGAAYLLDGDAVEDRTPDPASPDSDR